MGIGSVNIASTPCCGLIQRSYDCYLDEGSETGFTHNPGGDYAPGVEDFETETIQLRQGICPDCCVSFIWWLTMFGDRTSKGWMWDFSEAQRKYVEEEINKMSRYAVSYISFFDNDLKLKIVEAAGWKKALEIAFDINADWIPQDDMLEAQVEAFNQDWMFAVEEIE